MNDMDLLSHNDMREATPFLLLAVHMLYRPSGGALVSMVSLVLRRRG